MDPRQAMKRIASRAARIPNVLAEPASAVKILSLTPAGCVLAVRPYCNHSHYRQVYFGAQQAFRVVPGAAGYPAPEFVVELNAAD